MADRGRAGAAVSRGLIAAIFVAAGALHFVTPEFYLRIMPPYVPLHREMVALSGAAEILGGVGVLVPRVRRWAGVGLMLLLVAVFPANVEMALHPARYGVAPAAAWLRLPLQPLLVLWIWWATRERPDRPDRAR